MFFNPEKSRVNGYNVEMLNFYLKDKAEEYDPIGNFACGDMYTYIYACLIGLHKELLPLIPRAINHLNAAILNHEEKWFGASPASHAMDMHIGLAVALWINNEINSLSSWNEARIAYEIAVYNDDYCTKAMMAKECLDDYMALCFQAEQYELGIAEFEKYHGVKKISLKRKLPPRDFGYALCLHYSRGDFDADELFAAGRKMLQSKIEDDWLGYGQSIRAAIWLKIVYWHRETTLTPLEVILKAYENMPNVPRPDFV
ncbi:hypothetical protein HA050_03675 [Iodobacter sp. HSC-16F04]|uniref:Uncharacterized protein n=1 Tax=Iodobacter violaceini TaxID=3044271 RepID=A0ABX0KMA2_9NEIS|nr:hypothetical protein [Iodobacter violacea]NHQ85210.1 hypothetical protein [Iodobacter violacea]